MPTKPIVPSLHFFSRELYSTKPLAWIAPLALATFATAAYAAEISGLDTALEQATPSQYTAGGTGYLWGIGNNEVLSGFFVNGKRHTEIAGADVVSIQRVDIPGVATGEPCGVFAEYDSDRSQLVAGFPSGSTSSCDMESMLAGRIVNRGTLDTFSNSGPNPKNIERVDFTYSSGILASYSDAGLDVGGHIVAEKSGNNPVQIAAITSLDANGQPSSYGPLVHIGASGCAASEICYGITSIRHTYSFLQSSSIAPQSDVTLIGDQQEYLGAAFVSSRDLGLSVNQRYFGFSVFATDVNTTEHDLVDPSTFPSDTADNFITAGDGADLYGGMASLYWDESKTVTSAGAVVSGSAYLDQNGNNQFDSNDFGLSGVGVNLFADSNGDGQFDPASDALLAETFTDSSGLFVFPGIADGNYFAQLIDTNNALSSDLLLSSDNPVALTVSNGEASAVSFGFASTSSDGSVLAAADSATTPQGTPVTIDVLANDADPLSGGLTISSVTTSDNGAVNIVGNQLVFAPSSDFIGTANFSYTAEDASGATSTAAVAVNVLRFSDINNNGLDDYVECDCDDIRLITGIHGSGVAGGNGLWLLPLVGGLAFRRRMQQVLRGEVAK